MWLFPKPWHHASVSAQTKQQPATRIFAEKGRNWIAINNMERGKWHEARKHLFCAFLGLTGNQSKSGLLQKPCNPCEDGPFYNFFQSDFEAMKDVLEDVQYSSAGDYYLGPFRRMTHRVSCPVLHKRKACVMLWSKKRTHFPFPSIVFSAA